MAAGGRARVLRDGGTELLGAALTFLTPRAGLIGIVALLPLLALLGSTRRVRVVAARLGLVPQSRGLVTAGGLAAGACLLLALAATQPALRSVRHQDIRSRSEVTFVVDVSRSMAAAPSVGDESRLARARAIVARLRAAVSDVPSGLAGLTDRVLPYVFPTADAATFDETLRRSVLLEAPPPEEVATNATSFAALAALAQDGFFTAAGRRTCVLVTDAETRPYSTGSVADALDGVSGCRLIVVRVGGGGDRVFGPDGTPEANFVADPAAAANARALAAATGGRAFGEHDVGAAAAALRADAEFGPVRGASTVTSSTGLGPYVAAGALVLVLVLAGLRLRDSGISLIRT